MPSVVVKQFWMDPTQWPTPAVVAPTITRGALPARRRRFKPFLFDDETLLLLQEYLRVKVSRHD